MNTMISFFKKLFGTPANLKQVVADGAVIVDVRTPGEYAAGHIRGSLNIPLDTLAGNTAAIKQLNKPVVTVCRSGARSAVAQSLLEKSGVQVYNGGSWLTLKKQLGR